MSVRVSIYYPSTVGAEFDSGYYLQSHMPLVRDRLGAALLRDEVWGGLGDAENPAPYAAVTHLHFESRETFNEAFSVHGEELREDVVNFTAITPVIELEQPL